MKFKRYAILLLTVLLVAGLGSCSRADNTQDKEDLDAGASSSEEKNIAEGVIRQLQKEIAFGEQDILTFSNGYLESVDIKTRETAQMLFTCIRNCDKITDLTDVCLEPMNLPIQINGQGTGTFEDFYTTYQETGRFICIHFTPEDSERFQDYVMALQ